MKKITFTFYILLVTMFLLSISHSQAQQKIQGERLSVPSGMEQPEFAQERIKRLRQAANVLRKLAAQPLPDHLESRERYEALRYIKWLNDSSLQLESLTEKWDTSLKALTSKLTTNPTKLMAATKQIGEMNMSFNLQYLQLQQKMQAENRQFTLVSNIMKVKHDTARNAINNVR
jgi:hypothetical protein